MPDRRIENDGEGLLVQSPPCGRNVQVVSQPGRMIEIRALGRTVLSLEARCEHGHEPWLPDALQRAIEHALSEPEGGQDA
jgi:hypothetical protein